MKNAFVVLSYDKGIAQVVGVYSTQEKAELRIAELVHQFNFGRENLFVEVAEVDKLHQD